MAAARSRVVATGFPVKRRGSAVVEKSMGAWRRARMRGERLVRLRAAAWYRVGVKVIVLSKMYGYRVGVICSGAG